MSRPAVFLDRDGTLIVEREYLADPAGVELLPGVLDALRRLQAAGYALVVVTNQSGIARGYYSRADYEAVQARLGALLEEGGVRLDGVYVCPHHPLHGGECDCRKPGPALFERAARELELRFDGSAFVGDRLTDVIPALELGGRAVLVRTGYGREQAALAPAGVEVVNDLAAAVAVLLGG